MFYLLLAALNDDEGLFVQNLYIKYEKKIYGIALAIISNKHDAEDVVNTVMINVINNLTKFRCKAGNEIESQIVIYSRNAATDIYRQIKRRNEKENEFVYPCNDDDENIDIPDLDTDIEKIILSMETAEIIKRALAGLSAKDSDVIKLRLIYGYSSAETAKILGISTNSVGLCLHKAKKNLIEITGGELHERE